VATCRSHWRSCATVPPTPFAGRCAAASREREGEGGRGKQRRRRGPACHHVGREGEGERGRGRDEGGGGAGRGRSSAASEETERGDDGSVFFCDLGWGGGEAARYLCGWEFRATWLNPVQANNFR